MVRKSELTNATLSEINFTEVLWGIPKERMKRRNPHLVFLCRHDTDKPMSSAALNQVLILTYRLA